MNLEPNTPPLSSPPPVMDADVDSCQGCGAHAPVKQVMFFQHIGAIILMFNQHIKGRLCRNCINEHFARRTLVTSFVGWWGMISFLLTPFLLLNNVVRYLLCLSLKPAPDQPMRGSGLATAALIIAILALGAVVFLLVNLFGGPARA